MRRSAIRSLLLPALSVLLVATVSLPCQRGTTVGGREPISVLARRGWPPKAGRPCPGCRAPRRKTHQQTKGRGAPLSGMDRMKSNDKRLERQERRIRSDSDPYLSPKLREVRVTTRQARDALDELIGKAKKEHDRSSELIAIVLQKLVQATEAIDNDLLFIRNRLEAIERSIPPKR